MNLSFSLRTSRQPGFALVVALSLMILLTVIAVGLLSLSSISLRTVSAQAANSVARANARMALMLALGELQKAAGDDRRITADASIFDGAQNPNVVGVWKSWSPKFAENPLLGAPNYGNAKDSRFVEWLTSGASPADLTSKDWGKTGTLANPIELFTQKSDGFSLSSSKVDVLEGRSSSAGGLAWTMVQDATRAKINVGGPEDGQRVPNDDLQAQARPSLARSDSFNQPGKDWNQRAGRVISMAQAKLDPDLWKGGGTNPENAHFTSQGFGLLTDTVSGGLRTDLSLGFEMPAPDFAQNTWGSVRNPFRATGVTQFSTPSAYRGQRPLFRPLTASGSTHVRLNFSPANVDFDFPAAAVPTFDMLRSFYLTSYHLYETADGPTVFERGMENVALKAPTSSTGPGLFPANASSQTSFRPVLDRVLYVLSMGVGSDQEVRLIVTPLVTLWNPYNVALETDGAVLYPWMDFPFQANWNIGANPQQGIAMSQVLGVQYASAGHGRSVNPYFFASITASGSLPGSPGQSIRFKPGEVRLFAPASQTPIEYVANGSIRSRTLPLIPVTTASQLSIKGGLSIPMKNPVSGIAVANRKVAVTDSASVSLVPSTGSNYPFSVGLEDATRAMSANPTDATRGKLVCDVQTVNFSTNGSAKSLTSPRVTYAEMASPALRKPFGMIETYHRVASDSTGSRRSDLLFTTNPRQPFINRYLTNGDFQAGPHYETRTQQLSSLNNLIQTENNGRSAFYGASNSAGSGGKSQLSFFEVPQSPLLSLAAFQHADVSGTAYSTANQVGNSWASAYLARTTAAENLGAAGGGSGDATYTRDPMPVYDYAYLVNETLWDSFYFSGASPKVRPGTATGSPTVWNTDVANVTGSYKSVLTEFIDDPREHPLRNPRMRFHAGNSAPADLKAELVKPEGCLKLAAHLFVDGAFNINSTSEKAWIAFLGGMRDRSFDVRGGSAPSGGKTAFPRFRNPIGTDADNWMGFRSLSDSQMEQLAQQLVIEVKSRGPFLSLAEFVNRRVENTPLGLKGAIQAAIDNSGLNAGTLYDKFDPAAYPAKGRANISPSNTGVGIPGYLTQADVLQSIAPVMTARSDTFTIRGYGEARDSSGKVLATARCEAVVQRMPEFVDEANPPHATIAELNPANQMFGRRFSIVSFRYLSNNEVIL